MADDVMVPIVSGILRKNESNVTARVEYAITRVEYAIARVWRACCFAVPGNLVTIPGLPPLLGEVEHCQKQGD